MALTIFWTRIGIKRIINVIKSSPIIIIWTIIIIGSFVYAYLKNYIVIMLDTKIIIVLMPYLVLSSLIKSMKNYPVMTVLLKYSRSKLKNSTILKRHFIKQAVKNNILLIIFNIIMFNNDLINKRIIVIMLMSTSLSLVLSFFIIWIKYYHFQNKVNYKNKRSIKINVLIRSTIYDYLTPDFFATAIICIALFLFIFIEYFKSVSYKLENQSAFFTIITIILSIGFMGIIDSIRNINWKFQAIFSPNNFIYYIKLAMRFLFCFFGLPIIIFIIMGSIINVLLMLKFLYSILALFWVSIFIAFTYNNSLIKVIILSLIIIFTVLINTLSVVFLPVIVIPLLASFAKAKNEYKEWYLS
jgi:hypothetical protein